MSIRLRKTVLCFVVVLGLWLSSVCWGGYPSPTMVASNVAKNYTGLVSFKVKIEFASPLEGVSILYWQEGEKSKVEVLSSEENSTQICLIKTRKGEPWRFFSRSDFVSPYKIWREMGIDLSREEYLFFRHRPVLALGAVNSTESCVFVDIENMVEIKKRYTGGKEIVFDNYMDEGNYPFPSSFEIIIPGLAPLKGNLFWEMVNEKLPPQVFTNNRGGSVLFPLDENTTEKLDLLLKYFPSLK